MKRLRELLKERARRKKKDKQVRKTGHHPDISDTKEKEPERLVPLTEGEMDAIFSTGLEKEPRRLLCDDLEDEEDWNEW